MLKEIPLPFSSVCGYSDIRSLFDPIQTHAVYYVYKEDLDRVKTELIAKGASRFRVVKTGESNRVVLCFKYTGA